MIDTIIKYLPVMLKALVAMGLAIPTEIGLAQQDGITWGEWGYIVGTVAAIGYGVWKARNAGTQVPSEPVERPL